MDNRVAIHAGLMANCSAHTYCDSLIARARLYWFYGFFGTELDPKFADSFRTQNEVTSLPHIVGLRGENADSSSVALHGRVLYDF